MTVGGMKNLALERPIAFIDLETTGLSPSSDRIVELTVLKMCPDGSDEFKTARINPEMPIPTAATAIHGITDEDVADKPRFRQYAVSLREFLEGCDIGGFGVKRFDLRVLEAEFRRVGIEFSLQGRRIVDVLEIYHKVDPRDLAAAYSKYCGKQLEDGHTSMGDVRAAAEILERQLEAHPELPNDVSGLHAFCSPDEADWVDDEGKLIWAEGEATLNFGRSRGRTLREMAAVDPDYLAWIVDADFPAQLREIVSRALSGEFPQRREVE
jgi:DNA polymerase-3 subunit epsilon